MTDKERQYLQGMQKGFEGKAADVRKKIKLCSTCTEANKLDTLADNLEICASLVKQIFDDFTKYEEEPYEQETC